jgi:hypothetical protein
LSRMSRALRASHQIKRKDQHDPPASKAQSACNFHFSEKRYLLNLRATVIKQYLLAPNFGARFHNSLLYPLDASY